MKALLFCLMFFGATFVFAQSEIVDLRRELPSPQFYSQNRQELKLDASQSETLRQTLVDMNRSLSQAEATMTERAQALQDAIKDSAQSPEEVEQRLNALMKVENEVKAIRFHAGLAARRMLRPEQWQRASELNHVESRPRSGPVASLSDEKQTELANKLQSLRHLGEDLFPNGPPADLRRRVNEAQHKVRNGMIDDAFRLMDDLITELKQRRADTQTQP